MVCIHYAIFIYYLDREPGVARVTVNVQKMYWLGGETDSAIRWRKGTGVMLARGTEEAGC